MDWMRKLLSFYWFVLGLRSCTAWFAGKERNAARLINVLYLHGNLGHMPCIYTLRDTLYQEENFIFRFAASRCLRHSGIWLHTTHKFLFCRVHSRQLPMTTNNLSDLRTRCETGMNKVKNCLINKDTHTQNTHTRTHTGMSSTLCWEMLDLPK